MRGSRYLAIVIHMHHLHNNRGSVCSGEVKGGAGLTKGHWPGLCRGLQEHAWVTLPGHCHVHYLPNNRGSVWSGEVRGGPGTD